MTKISNEQRREIEEFCAEIRPLTKAKSRDVLILLIADKGWMKIPDIAAGTDQVYGNCHKLLKELLANGFVKRNDDNEYATSGKLLSMIAADHGED